MPKNLKGWRKGWPKQKPDLTREDAERLLSVARSDSHRDWLILRLIMQSGFKTGEVVGSYDKRTGSRVQGIRLRDIGEDFIWIQRLETPRDVEPELIREIRKFAFHRRPADLVFDLDASSVRKLTKNYAKKARIRDWAYVHPDSLKSLLAPRASQFRRELRKLFIDDIANAERMSDYYIANYCLENSIRRLIRETLSRYENWWDNKVPQTVRDAVRVRKEQEKNSPLSERLDDLEYTLFRELFEIMKQNWSDFSARVPKNMNVVGRILTDLNDLRNVIAHSGSLDKLGRDMYETSVRTWVGIKEAH